VEADVFNLTGAALNSSDPNNATFGDVTGALPGQLTLINDTMFNENLEAVTFGNTIRFLLELSGAGIDPTGNAGGTSGTTFLLDFLDATQSQYLFSNDPSGTTGAPNPQWDAAVIDLDNTGIATVYTNADFGAVRNQPPASFWE
jgi:hypothetical protein